MATIKVKELSLEAFKPYGTYAKVLDPETNQLGPAPCAFFPDMIQVNTGGEPASFSICRVEQRPMVIDVSEYHDFTQEGTLGLDGDMFIHVGKPTNGKCNPASFEVFRIPKGVFVTINPGVWHHAPFTVDGNPVNMLCVLPERTYHNDCTIVEFEDDEMVNISI